MVVPCAGEVLTPKIFCLCCSQMALSTTAGTLPAMCPVVLLTAPKVEHLSTRYQVIQNDLRGQVQTGVRPRKKSKTPLYVEGLRPVYRKQETLMKIEIAAKVSAILTEYDPNVPESTAKILRTYWLTFEPKSIEGIKAEARQMQETVGIPVPVLQAIGKAMAKAATKRVEAYIPLARILWESFGREGRVISVYPLGAMELVQPRAIIPILVELCRTCVTWEDADQLSMRALEPIVRKDPAGWLPALDSWLTDENKWVRRAGVTAVGRLTMAHPNYTARCLAMIKDTLFDEEMDVKRAVSFAIRLSARGEIAETVKFLDLQIPPKNPAATWVLCDAVRSMTKKFLLEFKPILPNYTEWAADPNLSPRDRQSVESAIKTLLSA